VTNEAVRRQFTAALDALVADLKRDRSIVAAILCGSLSHDTVWARSDIDLALVTVDDKLVPQKEVALHADGINVHAFVVPRAGFRKLVDGAIHNSFIHAVLAKGRLLYTHDETIADLCTRLTEVGERDTRVQLLDAGTDALHAIYKAHKWLLTRGDLDYTALWILYAATPLARMEVLAARQLADREVIPQALALNPGFFRTIYVDLLNQRKTRAAVQAALNAVDDYVAELAERVFAPILEHLREVGEARGCAELDDHFQRHFGIHSVITACEYLADRGRIGKAAVTARVTRKSNVDVQELAFFYQHGDREPRW
jgi:predicted nucleotidyltransferase